jgi:hypothetical protein
MEGSGVRISEGSTYIADRVPFSHENGGKQLLHILVFFNGC